MNCSNDDKTSPALVGREAVDQGERLARTRHRARSTCHKGWQACGKQHGEMRFTALLHHLTVNLLRESSYSLKNKAAPGVDGVTWVNRPTHGPFLMAVSLPLM